MNRLLHWLLRRHVDADAFDPGRPEGPALVLVYDHPGLVVDGDRVTLGEHTARVVRGGELVVRRALLTPGALVAVVPPERTLERDLVERAWLRQPLVVDLRDRIAAAAERRCGVLTDQALVDGIERRWDELAPKLARLAGSDGRPIGEPDLRGLLEGQVDGGAATRRPAAEVLAEWLIDGLPEAGRRPATHAALRRWQETRPVDPGYGPLADVIAARVDDPSRALSALITLGAVGGIPSARAGFGPRELERADDARALVEDAIARVWVSHRPVAEAALAPAERRLGGLKGLGIEDLARAPLLRASFDALAARLLARAAAPSPRSPDADELRALRRCLQADPAMVAAVVAAGRLSAFAAGAELHMPAKAIDAASEVASWARFGVHHVAPADRLARELLRMVGALPRAQARDVMTLVERARAVRDTLNDRFARTLARREVPIYGRRPAGDGMSLHLVTGELVRPLLQAGERVLLVVLDGCDGGAMREVLAGLPPTVGLSSFHTIADGGRWHSDGISMAWRRVHDAMPDGMLGALSPLPTLTAVGRRALFAGQIPSNAALTEREASASDAADDRKAWASNPAVADFDPALILKGELGDDGDGLRALLDVRDGDPPRAVAVVFNGVDDALSSKQTTPLGPWTPAAVHPALPRLLEDAVRAGWRVVMTADHGHTPYAARDRKVAGKSHGQRIPTEAAPGAVRFGPTPWRSEAVHLLTPVGAWLGTQRRGFHGGAGLEEVVVPVMLLGPVEPGEGRLREPDVGWMWAEGDGDDAAGSVEVGPPDSADDPVEPADEPWPEPAPEPVVRPDTLAPPTPPPMSSPAPSPVPSPPEPIRADAPAPEPPAPEPPAPEPPAPAPAAEPAPWLDAFADAGVRAALAHLDKHGTLTDPQLARLLGSARQGRRFARRFDGYRERLPFRVEVQSVNGVKRYEKLGR